MSRELEPEANQLRRQSFELVKQAIFEAGLSKTVDVSSFSSSMDSGKLSDGSPKEATVLGRQIRTRLSIDSQDRIVGRFSVHSDERLNEVVDIFYSTKGGVVAISDDGISRTVYILDENSKDVDFSDPLALRKINATAICMARGDGGKDEVVATYRQTAEEVGGTILCRGVWEEGNNISFPVSYATLCSQDRGLYRIVAVHKDPNSDSKYEASVTVNSPTLKILYHEDGLSWKEAAAPETLLDPARRDPNKMIKLTEREVCEGERGGLVTSIINHESGNKIQLVFNYRMELSSITLNDGEEHVAGVKAAVVDYLQCGETRIVSPEAGIAFVLSSENLILDIFPVVEEGVGDRESEIPKAFAFLKEVQHMLKGLELPSDFPQIRDINIPDNLITNLANGAQESALKGFFVTKANIKMNGRNVSVELETQEDGAPFEALNIYHSSSQGDVIVGVLFDEGEPHRLFITKMGESQSEHLTTYDLRLRDDDSLQVEEWVFLQYNNEKIFARKALTGVENFTSYTMARENGYVSVLINDKQRLAEIFEKGQNGPTLKRYSIPAEVDLSTPQAAIEYVNGELDDKDLTVKAWKNDINGISTCIAHLDGEIITLNRFSLPSSRVTYEVNGEYCTPFDGEDGLKCLRAESGKTYYYIENHKLGVIELIARLDD